MALTEEQRAYHRAWHEAHKDATSASFKRWHEAHGKARYYENVELTRAIKRKSYHVTNGNADAAAKEQELIDSIRLQQPRKQTGAKVKYSDAERIIRRKACVRKARYRHISGVPFAAASFHGPTILDEPAVCEACGGTGKMCMDHDHVTSKFRGWLCNDCNLALGRAKDSITVLEALVQYLKKRQ